MKADFEKGTKVCSRCKKELPLNMFGKKKSSNDNLCPYCKQCQKEYSRKMQDKIGTHIWETWLQKGKRWKIKKRL